MMARTQIALEPELHRQARARSAELGVSLAEYVRRLVRDDIAGPRPRADVSIVFNLGSADGSDVARHKDAYLAEAVGADSHSARAGGRRHR